MVVKKKLGVGLAFVAIVALSAFGGGKRNNSLNFSGAIGVDAVSNVVVNGTTVTVSPNVVRGISPSGQICGSRISTRALPVTDTSVFADAVCSWAAAMASVRTVGRAYSPLYSADRQPALPHPAQTKPA